MFKRKASREEAISEALNPRSSIYIGCTGSKANGYWILRDYSKKGLDSKAFVTRDDAYRQGSEVIFLPSDTETSRRIQELVNTLESVYRMVQPDVQELLEQGYSEKFSDLEKLSEAFISARKELLKTVNDIQRGVRRH